ncbi:putative GPI-anchored protein pfl2 [Morone saxatilis]|uniref:putative GPI-anchored protein pfl2 n=1 Tax=Morone saxatilis TaxID=34816 RepID=UPI0015E1F340|nr:putative GPI-anchored protein pfl2 [Morone saxatilis]XP_035517038.1 putative GPI-anchored protein pfl2 [Morone saxatilis]
MAMDTFATLACCLLALSFAVAQTENGSLTTIAPTISTPDVNLTHTTTMASNSTVPVTVISNSTENATPFTNTTHNNETFTKTTAATTESTSHLQTSQPTTIMTPLTNSTSLTKTTPGNHTPTFNAPTTPAMQTTEANISTPDTTVITTANLSSTVYTTSDSLNRTTQGLRLNMSEKNMTILFSVVLGVFATAVVVFMFHQCKQKIQYLHQPLNNTDDTDAFVADDDTLVISGGLYDGHPIYDNVPTPSADQSQFRLEFLH